MKNAIVFFSTLLMIILKSVFWAALFSALFCFIKWIGSLLFKWNTPTWTEFWAGGLTLFVLFFVHRLLWIIRDMKRRMREPEYDFMANSTGISYNEYVRLKNEKENDKKQKPPVS